MFILARGDKENSEMPEALEMKVTFEEMCSTIVTLTQRNTARLNSDDPCATLRAITDYVKTASPSTQLSAREKFDVRGWLDECIALVLGNQLDRIERFKRLPMYRMAIEALNPPQVIEAIRLPCKPGSGDPSVVEARVGDVMRHVEQSGQ